MLRLLLLERGGECHGIRETIQAGKRRHPIHDHTRIPRAFDRSAVVRADEFSFPEMPVAERKVLQTDSFGAGVRHIGEQLH